MLAARDPRRPPMVKIDTTSPNEKDYIGVITSSVPYISVTRWPTVICIQSSRVAIGIWRTPGSFSTVWQVTYCWIPFKLVIAKPYCIIWRVAQQVVDTIEYDKTLGFIDRGSTISFRAKDTPNKGNVS